jgi:hypothetical protein
MSIRSKIVNLFQFQNPSPVAIKTAITVCVVLAVLSGCKPSGNSGNPGNSEGYNAM